MPLFRVVSEQGFRAAPVITGVDPAIGSGGAITIEAGGSLTIGGVLRSGDVIELRD